MGVLIEHPDKPGWFMEASSNGQSYGLKLPGGKIFYRWTDNKALALEFQSQGDAQKFADAMVKCCEIECVAKSFRLSKRLWTRISSGALRLADADGRFAFEGGEMWALCKLGHDGQPVFLGHNGSFMAKALTQAKLFESKQKALEKAGWDGPEHCAAVKVEVATAAVEYGSKAPGDLRGAFAPVLAKREALGIEEGINEQELLQARALKEQAAPGRGKAKKAGL